MPGLSHRRPTYVTAVLRGMIKGTLCISVAESECAVFKQIVSAATVCLLKNSAVTETLP